MKKLGRNDPCWCGSGRKFKKCHLGREQQEEENSWDAVDQTKKAFNQKRCCAAGAGLGDCQGQIVKAHTISRGPNLKKIAVDGEVLYYAANHKGFEKSGGKPSLEKIGINKASVFNGFCEKHDRDLFSCIENKQFIGLPDQCLAVAYRTICREHYLKDAATEQHEILHGFDKGKSPAEQLFFQKFIRDQYLGNDAGRRDSHATVDLLASAISNRQHDAIESFIFEFDEPLMFMCAGAWSPLVDLYGNAIQDGNSAGILDQVLLSSFAGDGVARVCISWRNAEGAPGKVIAEQIAELPAEAQASAILQLAVRQIENVFFNRYWHRDLPIDQKSHLDFLANIGVGVLGGPQSSTVKLDLGFNLPRASGIAQK